METSHFLNQALFVFHKSIYYVICSRTSYFVGILEKDQFIGNKYHKYGNGYGHCNACVESLIGGVFLCGVLGCFSFLQC